MNLLKTYTYIYNTADILKQLFQKNNKLKKHNNKEAKNTESLHPIRTLNFVHDFKRKEDVLRKFQTFILTVYYYLGGSVTFWLPISVSMILLYMIIWYD